MNTRWLAQPPLLRSSFELLGVTLLYSMAAWFSTLFVLHPEAFTLLWFPAAVAVASMMLFGRSMSIGIWIGALIIHIIRSPNPASAITLGTSVMIASSVTIQAIVIARYIKRWFTATAEVFIVRNLVQYIAIVALGCTITATVGTASLTIAVPFDVFTSIKTWGSWWISDTLGILVGLPVLIAVARHIQRRHIYGALAMVIFSFGMSATIMLFSISWSLETQMIRSRFMVDARTAHSAIEMSLMNVLHCLEAVEHLYNASSTVTRSEFRSFTQNYIEGSQATPGLQAIEWIPHVHADQRSYYEDRARKDGFATFHISELDDSGNTIPANQRNEYFPVYYVEPFSGNERALGLDIGAERVRREALERARDTGIAVATAPLNLVQLPAEQQSVLLFWPIYRYGTPIDTLASRRENLRGFAVGAIRIHDIVAAAMRQLPVVGRDVYLFDMAALPQQQLLSFNPSPKHAQPTAADPTFDPRLTHDPMNYAAAFTVAGRPWVIIIKPVPGIIEANRSGMPVAMLITGVAINVLLAAYVVNRQRYTMQIAEERALLAQRVEERTADLNSVNAQLSQALRAKDAFLANMSHELRTPLHSILAVSETLQEQRRGPLNERQLASLRTIETSGHHLLALINDILDLSKMEAGKFELQWDVFRIADVCESSLMFVRDIARKKEINLSFHLNDPAALIEADPRRIKQILVNLLSNAVKFTPTNGEVRLTVAIQRDAAQIAFAIEDTGIGIAPEDASRLFQPFSQLDSRLSRLYEGSGLGLALVRHLAELHGGGITLTSTVGRGSCFTVTLPYYPPIRMAEEREPGTLPYREAIRTSARESHEQLMLDRANGQAFNASVLLAEDNRTHAMATSEYLEELGYRVSVVYTGKQAIDRVEAIKADIIVMDIQMPEMDGITAIKALRLRHETHTIPIIALTALAMPGDRERCLASGATIYLTKPVSPRQLVTIMVQCLNQSRM